MLNENRWFENVYVVGVVAHDSLESLHQNNRSMTHMHDFWFMHNDCDCYKNSSAMVFSHFLTNTHTLTRCGFESEWIWNIFSYQAKQASDYLLNVFPTKRWGGEKVGPRTGLENRYPMPWYIRYVQLLQLRLCQEFCRGSQASGEAARCLITVTATSALSGRRCKGTVLEAVC